MGQGLPKNPIVSEFEQATTGCMVNAVTDTITGRKKQEVDDKLANCLQTAINNRPKRGEGLFAFLKKKDRSLPAPAPGVRTRFQFGQQTNRTRYESADASDASEASEDEVDDSESDTKQSFRKECKTPGRSGVSLGHVKSAVVCR
jgi:type IV secretory pathway VirB10-like protein